MVALPLLTMVRNKQAHVDVWPTVLMLSEDPFSKYCDHIICWNNIITMNIIGSEELIEQMEITNEHIRLLLNGALVLLKRDVIGQRRSFAQKRNDLHFASDQPDTGFTILHSAIDGTFIHIISTKHNHTCFFTILNTAFYFDLFLLVFWIYFAFYFMEPWGWLVTHKQWLPRHARCWLSCKKNHQNNSERDSWDNFHSFKACNKQMLIKHSEVLIALTVFQPC